MKQAKRFIDDSKTKDYCGGGVYAIINDENGKMYVGSSKNVSDRIKQHNRNMANLNCAYRLNEDVKRGDTFHSELLEKIELPCTIGFMLEREEYYSKLYDTQENGYNGPYFTRFHPEKMVYAHSVKHDRINLTVDAGGKEAWTEAAHEHGMDSLNDFIRYCVEKEIGGDSDD